VCQVIDPVIILDQYVIFPVEARPILKPGND